MNTRHTDTDTDTHTHTRTFKQLVPTAGVFFKVYYGPLKNICLTNLRQFQKVNLRQFQKVWTKAYYAWKTWGIFSAHKILPRKGMSDKMVVSWATVAMARGAKKYPKMGEKGVLAICSLRASGPTPLASREPLFLQSWIFLYFLYFPDQKNFYFSFFDQMDNPTSCGLRNQMQWFGTSVPKVSHSKLGTSLWGVRCPIHIFQICTHIAIGKSGCHVDNSRSAGLCNSWDMCYGSSPPCICI